jgi:hypothetical protein
MAGANPFLRVLSLDLAALVDSLRGITTEVGNHGREHRLKIDYEPREPLATDHGVTYEYERCENIYFTPPVLGDDWAFWGDQALHHGALPLLVLGLVSLGLRLRARRQVGAWTLRSAPTFVKALLAALTLAPFAAFAVAFALALCVWMAVEVVPWLQWFDSVAQITEAVILKAGPPLLGALLLAGALAVYGLLCSPRLRATSPDRWSRRRALRLLVWGPLVVALILGGLLPFLHAARLVPVLGADASLTRWCSSCHAATAPLFFVRSPDDWRRSLEATCFPRAAVPEADRDEIVAFLSGMRSFPDSWVFRTRCQRCHVASAFTWDDRHPDDWASIVQRVARYSPYYYNEAVQEQVVRHLATTSGSDDTGAPDADGARRRLAVRSCTPCHFFSRNAEAHQSVSEPDAYALVQRMNERMFVPLSASDLRDVAAVWRDVVRSPDKLRALVPHDRPVLEGGLPW